MVDINQELREGKLLLNANQFAEAEKVFSKCCAEAPESSEAWFSFGVVRNKLGKVEGALLAFDQAIRFDPMNIPAYNAKASMLSSLERHKEALEVIEQTLKLHPDNTKTLTNYGVLLFQQSNFIKAKRIFDRALAQDHFIPAALEYRSMVLTKLGRSDQALADAELLSRLLPNLAMPRLLKASAHLSASRYAEALTAAQEASQLDRKNINAIVVTAMAQAAMGQFEYAAQSFSLAESLDARGLGEVLAQQITNLPSGMQSDPVLLYLTLARRRLNACNWLNRNEYLQALTYYLMNINRIKATEADIMLLHAAYFSPIDPTTCLELAKYVALDVSVNVNAFRYSEADLPERLKVGYLAESFNGDSFIKDTAAIYELHNRSDFEVYCYSLEPSDNSEFNDQIKKHCDHFVELYPKLNFEAASKIHQDGIHILVHLDGMSRDFPYELLAHQPAPLQVSYGGTLLSSGAGFIQYRICDSMIMPPDYQDQWTEKLVCLPDFHDVYDQPPTGVRRLSRESEGLPPSGMVFCCFCEADLIEPEIFQTWMKILQRTKDSVLWLSQHGEDGSRNLRNEAYGHGVKPGRLIFAEPAGDRAQELARYGLADLYLETSMLNECRPVSDALWAGIPVLTQLGETMATRLTASKLSALELSSLICKDQNEYIERACHLAEHPDFLEITKRKIQRHALCKPLFETQRTVLYLEEAYREMWHRYLRGDPLENFSVIKDE